MKISIKKNLFLKIIKIIILTIISILIKISILMIISKMIKKSILFPSTSPTTTHLMISVL